MELSKIYPSFFRPSTKKPVYKIDPGKWFIVVDRLTLNSDFPGIVTVGNSSRRMELTGEIMCVFQGEYLPPRFDVEVFEIDEKSALSICLELVRASLSSFGFPPDLLPVSASVFPILRTKLSL